MEVPESYRRAHAQIIQHPYRQEYGKSGPLVASMVAADRFCKVADSVGEVTQRHAQRPFDLLVGDDVSGRIPALITYHVMRQAHSSERAAPAPSLVFMPSGHIGGQTWVHEWVRERRWRKQLSDRAAQILGTLSTQHVGVITDIVTTGKSLDRIEAAFSGHGADVESFVLQQKLAAWFYLRRGAGYIDERQFTGVEKTGLAACTVRHPEFDARQVGGMRRFIADYAVTVYNALYDDALTLPSLVASAKRDKAAIDR